MRVVTTLGPRIRNGSGTFGKEERELSSKRPRCDFNFIDPNPLSTRRDRKHLEALIGGPDNLNDIVMCDEEGRLLEGTQTNFYAITSEGVLHTAGGGLVLEGTVRRLILQVCSEEGIAVDETPPRVSDLGSWQGALLSSTSRLALPIHWLGAPQQEGKAWGGAARSFTYGEGCLALRIAALVAARVVDASTAIFSP